jgi:glycyl-tRNA synthetase
MIRMSDIEEIAKRRGFFWKSSEIYGGLAGLYDYGHLGTLVKRKWENLWRNFFLKGNFYEIEPANIMHEKVFVASGHVDSFVDPIVKCKKCKNAERADQILEDQLGEKFEGLQPKELDKIIKKHNIKCPKCKGPLEETAVLNMLFPLSIGAENPSKAYMRGETAQGVYVNFRRTFEHMRKQLPFGLAIVGKAFRNEVSPRNALIRMREFSQAELQIFFDPEKINEQENFDEIKAHKLHLLLAGEKKEKEMSCGDMSKKLPKMYVYYMAQIQKFYLDVLKIQKEKFRFRELSDEEKAFYNKYHWDIELKMGVGWKEVAGLHYRTDHDLKGHQKLSKESMEISVEGKRFVPHVLELSFGVDRNIYAMLDFSLQTDVLKERQSSEEKERSVVKFPKLIAPFDCAIFPLVSKDNLPEKAREIKELLKGFSVFYDESGSIGRRYRRMDEIGVPACITIDSETLENDTVTLRDRDSMKQERISVSELPEKLREFLEN